MARQSADTPHLEPSVAERYFYICNGEGGLGNERRDQNLDRAGALPPHERITLIEDVLDSLDHADPAIDQMWLHEASERLAAYRRGELAAKDLSEIVAKYRP